MPDVTIHPGYYLIDTRAWVSQRTADPDDTLTSLLAEFLRCDVFDGHQPNMDTTARMQLWCAARQWTQLEGSPIWHDHQVLTHPAEIVLATDPDGNAWALVSIDYTTPVVYRDVTTDDGYWHQVTPVDIVCPDGHRWNWLDERTLLDSNGADVVMSDIFGPDRDKPFQPCRGCQAFDDDRSDQMCPCDNTTAIYCPVCDARCTLELAEVPTHPEHSR